MYAVFATVDIDAARGDEAEVLLHNTVVPDVKRTPGFVSGTWMRSTDGTRGCGVILFEREDAARAAAEQASPPPAGAPVTARGFEVFEVLAQA